MGFYWTFFAMTTQSFKPTHQEAFTSDEKNIRIREDSRYLWHFRLRVTTAGRSLRLHWKITRWQHTRLLYTADIIQLTAGPLLQHQTVLSMIQASCAWASNIQLHIFQRNTMEYRRYRLIQWRGTCTVHKTVKLHDFVHITKVDQYQSKMT
jgi:hypothetical protein